MGFWKWSKTAANNATADSNINWAEGQTPGSVNDSARQMMARIAEWRDDISGTLTTGGSGNAYTVTTNTATTTLSNGWIGVVKFDRANTGSATFQVDSTTSAPLVRPNGDGLASGDIASDDVGLVIYIPSLSKFVLLGRTGNTVWDDGNFASRISALTENASPTGTEYVPASDGKKISLQQIGQASTYLVDDYAALKAKTGMSDGHVAVVGHRTTKGDGGGGIFEWYSGDQSTNVTNDPQSGIWVAPNSDTTGASGAWRRSIEASDAVYVEWFGAVPMSNPRGGSPSSSESSYTAIQAAIDWVIWASTNDDIVSHWYEGDRTVALGAGSYYIDSSLVLKSQVNLRGAGKYATTIRYEGTGSAIKTNGVYGTVARNIYITSLGVVNLDNPTTSTATAIDLSFVSRTTVRDCYVRGFKTGVYGYGGWDIVIDRCQCHNQNQYGIHLKSYTHSDGTVWYQNLTSIHNCFISGAGKVGILATDCQGLDILGANVESGSEWGIRINGGIIHRLRGLHLEYNGTGGILVTRSSSDTASRKMVVEINGYRRYSNTASIGLKISADNCDVVIQNFYLQQEMDSTVTWSHGVALEHSGATVYENPGFEATAFGTNAASFNKKVVTSGTWKTATYA